MADQQYHSLPTVSRQQSTRSPWIPPRKRPCLVANTFPTTSAEASPGSLVPDVPDTQDSKDDSVNFGAVDTSNFPTALADSTKHSHAAGNDVKDADDYRDVAKENVEVNERPKVTPSSTRHEPPKYSRRNAHCTHCDSRTTRWPGTLCPPCGERWRETGIPANAKTCNHCGNADTCRWLRGPDGVQTLCNACGKRWLKTGSLEYMRLSGTTWKWKAENNAVLKRESDTLRGPECTHCGTRATRIWRTGPAGRRTLCDECGIRWKRGEELIAVEKEEDVLATDEVEDHDEESMMAYQPRLNKRKPAPNSPNPAPTHSVSATDLDYDNDGDHCNLSSESVLGTNSATPSARSRALTIVDELEKASELAKFVLQSSDPSLERLKAVNRFISVGLRNLRDETMRAINE